MTIFCQKKNYATISWLKSRRNRNFHEVFILFLSFLYSLFWFLFHSSHSAVILKNFHWSLSKIAFFASEVMSEKTCKLLPLINIHADLFSFLFELEALYSENNRKWWFSIGSAKFLSYGRPSRLALVWFFFHS